MKRGVGRLGVLVLFLGFSLLSGREFPRPPEGSRPNHKPQEAIERTLFDLVNLEREKGGLGVSFGRLKNYPGGAFCVALVLFPKYE